MQECGTPCDGDIGVSGINKQKIMLVEKAAGQTELTPTQCVARFLEDQSIPRATIPDNDKISKKRKRNNDEEER